MNLLQSIHKIEIKIDLQVERFFFEHPFLGYPLLLVGIPLCSLILLFVGCVLLTFPLALLFGWL